MTDAHAEKVLRAKARISEIEDRIEEAQIELGEARAELAKANREYDKHFGRVIPMGCDQDGHLVLYGSCPTGPLGMEIPADAVTVPDPSYPGSGR